MPEDLEGPDRPPLRMCGLCNEKLTPLGPTKPNLDPHEASSYRWLHARRDTDESHQPYPVPIMDEANGPVLVCDFCGDYGPIWNYPAENFQLVGDVNGFDSGRDWTACDACAQLINADKYDALAHRALKQHKVRGQLPPQQHRDELLTRMRIMHMHFKKHRTGPPEPMQNTYWLATGLATIFQSGD